MSKKIFRWTDQTFPLDPFARHAILQCHMDASLLDLQGFDDLPEEYRTDLSKCQNQVMASQKLRHWSNIIRYRLLFDYGGLWLDYDMIPFQNLMRETHPWTAATRMHKREGAVLWFPEPGHPMLKAMLDRIYDSPDGNYSCVQVSGAQVLHEVGKDFPDVEKEQRVFPLDAGGFPSGVNPIAVHLWISSQGSNHES